MKRSAIFLMLAMLLGAASPAFAQYADRGVTVPVTATAGAMFTERLRAADPSAKAVAGGFHTLLSPSLRWNSRWYLYSAIDVQLKPFHYYDATYGEKEVEARFDHLFLGYSWKAERSSIAVKAGQMSSAFGAFPLRYDDRANPLLDQPLAYAYAVKLRPDQMPCGVDDLVHQKVYPSYTHHYCGGSTTDREGMTPATEYGIPGIEIDATWRRWDVRLQAVNSSPANPQALDSPNQHFQWIAGGGFTISQGFRVGVSGFRGPFLEKDVTALLPTGAAAGDYPASGIGIEGQWALRRWSVNAEWQHFVFRYPKFIENPSIDTGYAEIKAIVTPRIYTAFRGGFTNYGRVEDTKGVTAKHFLPNIRSWEAAVGYHLNRYQTVKLGYEWYSPGCASPRNNVLGLQVVTSFNALSQAF